LRQGDAGTAVRQLQTLLRDRGFLQGPIDGAFGPATEAAVRSAQQRYDLTVDGIVGPATWERLTQGS
jgi:peptidoglycan hydrolase-like protein with peptidoglycan-binding domain